MTKSVLKSVAIAASSFVLFGIAPAYAGADAVRAEAYFNAISGGNPETITSFYADDAEFHWVGGPLAGVYKGKDKIKGVWDRFSKAAGDLDHEVLQLSESANGKTSTVTARVKFKGEGEVPVKFIMVYKDGKIASEVWQVDKPGVTYAKADGKGGDAKAEPKAEVTPEAKTDPKVAAKLGAPSGTKVSDAAPADGKPADAAPVVTKPADARPAAPVGNERVAAKAPDQSVPGDKEPGGPDAEDLPEGGEGPDAAAGASPVPLPAAGSPARKAEIAPGKDVKPEPKLGGGEPKLKAAEDKKKAGYGEKSDGYEKKAQKPKKRYYGDGYGYDGYGHGHGGYGGYGGYGGGYGRGGYGHY